MARLAIINDTHIGVRNDNPIFQKYLQRSFDWFFKEIDDRGIKTVLHLGDLYDRRKYINFITSKIARESFLEPLETRGIETHIITGNHDIYWKNTVEVNSLEELVAGRYKHISTYFDPVLINVDGLDIQLIPWICATNQKESYKAIETTRAEVLMGHLELKGFEMFRNSFSDHGDDIDIFKRFDLVFSGHYHRKSSRGNIHYLGAFGEFTWADYNDPRGFTIFDTETREFTFHQNPHTVFKIITYDDSNKDMMEEIKNTDFSELSNTYTRIVCSNRENMLAFDTMLDKIYKANPMDISIIEDVNTILDSDKSLDDLAVDESKDTVEILGTYIDSMSLPLDTGRMKKLMRDIYADAISTKHVE